MRSQRYTGLILIVPLAFLLWGFFLIYHRNSVYGAVAGQLPSERAAAKREGLPLTPEALQPSPPVSDAQNAAPRYLEILDAMQRLPTAY
ncbi:MAG TPA: hypothetical protein VKU00_26295, partial [Chthonomonadaceae bacterium]|nr:hypothetical protein [Chthonomonadaceae bacterium]